MDNDMKSIVDGSSNALKEINTAINYAQESLNNVRSSSNNFQSGFGGQSAKGTNDNIQNMCLDFNRVINGLTAVTNSINQEKNNLLQSMK
jgi:hypothetical protein